MRNALRSPAPETDMVIALAGRSTGAPDVEQERFPFRMNDAVRQRLLELFSRRSAAALVCSAACGDDLLALDAAGELGLRRRVVLPFAPDRFRATSVTDRPGDWGPLFDRIIEKITAAGDLVVVDKAADEAQAYEAANLAILDNAELLEEQIMSAPKASPNPTGTLAVAV